ncbi:hypothetical protein AB205_0175740 [Aquarana catesbeiana]|uniref:Uncharacterized protein n=1 Tax=Aquarana catesbeiana TaxID=8400 RepID=A0A2G9QGL5_AQUCT|nr:hypothetical protein AB205_0175740 [Aquarana catesbeiana]
MLCLNDQSVSPLYSRWFGCEVTGSGLTSWSRYPDCHPWEAH